MKRGTIINNRIIKKEPQTQKLTERTNTDTLQDLSIPLQCGGERHPAAAQTRHTEVTALRDLHNLSKGEVKFLSEQRELRNLGGGQTNPHLHTEWLLKESNHPHQTQNRHPGGFSEGRRVCAANPARMIKQPNEAKFCEGKMKWSALAVSARIIRYNLFQGLANVTGVDDLNNKTAVNCDECQILKRVQNDVIGVVVPPPEPLNSRKFVKWFRPPLRRGHQANHEETISNTQEYRNNRKEQLQMKTKNKINESTAQTNSRNGLNVLTSYRLNVFEKRVAFTLAETLITLAIIGVVAAITIPSLVKNYNEKAWGTAKDVFEKRLEVATRQMNTEEKLAGYSNTMDFVNELKKYIKITRVCDNNNITKCFNKEVIWNEGEDPIDMSTIKNAASLGQDDWDTDTVAVQFANGVNAIIAYNPNTTQEPFNNQFSATSNSMAILYDVSGNKNPNTNGKDIGKINVENLAGVTGCMIPELADTMCITQILGPQNGGYGPLTYAECTEAKNNGEIDVDACYNGSSPDYFAGAVKACGGKKANLPSQDQLTQLANYIYNTDSVSSSGPTSSLAMDTEKAAQFLSASPGSSSGWFFVWSGQENSSNNAYYRDFSSTRTIWSNGYRDGSTMLAVCIDQ